MFYSGIDWSKDHHNLCVTTQASNPMGLGLRDVTQI
jgi:hypothetical protein